MLLEKVILGPQGVHRLVAVLEYLCRVANVEAADLRDFVRELSPPNVEDAMTTLAERMQREGREFGMRKGQAKLLPKQLRLSELPRSVIERVESGTEGDFERWAERVLAAESLEEIFGDSASA